MTSEAVSSTPTVIGLSALLICLVALLIFLYKKLNRETNGEYTIHQIVYKEGGIRDRARRATLALETRLGVHLWPRSDSDEDGEEMQEIQDEEEQVDEGGSQGSDSEGDDQEEEEEEDEDEDEDEDEAGNNALLCGKTKGKGDDTSEKSNLEDSDAGGQSVLTDQSEAQEETDEKKEKKGEKEGDGEGKKEASGGTGLLIDLKQFSGSAIWSEENKGDGTDGDMTAL